MSGQFVGYDAMSRYASWVYCKERNKSIYKGVLVYERCI